MDRILRGDNMEAQTILEPEQKKKKNKKHKDLNRPHGPYFVIVAIFLVFYSITLFIPLIWGVITSFKDIIDFHLNRFGLPEVWNFENYLLVFKVMRVQVATSDGFRFVYIPEMIKNSLVYAVGSTFLSMFILYSVAYVSARFPYKWVKMFYYINLFAMIFPMVGTTASNLAVAHQLKLIDSMLGIFILQGHFIGGMTFLVLYAQLESFSRDFSDAAYIDGAGNFRIMYTIIFPMCKPTILTYALLMLIGKWNDYSTPLFYMPNVPTIAYGVYYFNLGGGNNQGGTSASNIPVTIASCLEATLPTFIMFLLFQNKLLGNFTVGGIKE